MKAIKVGILHRSATLDREKTDKEKRMIRLSFSSEEPVDRWFGKEILDHSKGSVDLSRLNDAAPLLLGHNPDDQIGVVEDARLDGKRGVADVRFSQSVRAQEIFNDVADGIRRNVSVGYRVRKMTLEEEQDDGPSTYRVTDWVPLEVSIVSVPADNSVGVGRAADNDPQEVIIETRGHKQMEPNTEIKLPPVDEPQGPDIEVIQEEASKAERQRIGDILAIARQSQRHNPRRVNELAEKAIKEGQSADEFRRACFDLVANAQPIQTPEPGSDRIGMKPRDIERYSFRQAILSASEGRLDPLVREVSDEYTRKIGKAPNGSFWIPPDVLHEGSSMMHRDVLAGATTVSYSQTGGNIIAQNLLAGSFIELLRNRMMVRTMGATILDGLVGDVRIPRQSAAATASWSATEQASTTDTSQTFDQVSMTPKNCTAITDYTKQLLMQSTPSVDALIRSDLATILALAQDAAALHGTGSSGQPTGIINATGVLNWTTELGGASGLGPTGGYPTWRMVVELETLVANANADVGSLGYLTNSKVRGVLKFTDKTGAMMGQFIWNDSAQGIGNQLLGQLNGYRAGVTNQVASNLIKSTRSDLSVLFFGNWSDLIIGQWGGLDVLVDPFTQAATRTIRVVATLFTDVCVRHGSSFSFCKEIQTV